MADDRRPSALPDEPRCPVIEAIRLTEAALAQLAAQWRRHDAPIARRLAPGLSDAEMDALSEPLGLRVPPEARTWWRWHNGADNAFIVTSGGKAFASLERCVSRAAQMREIARDVARQYNLSGKAAGETAREVWDSDWLPLSEDGAGSMLVIDAAVDNSPRELCPVWYRAIDDGSDGSLIAPSIGALVYQWTVVLEVGKGSYNPDVDRWTLDHATLPDGFDRRLL